VLLLNNRNNQDRLKADKNIALKRLNTKHRLKPDKLLV
jgi:hypothetical protein